MHHAQALTKQPNDQIVHQEGEEASVGKVTQNERVDVPFVESVGAECEIVHVTKHVVRRPHHV